MTGNDIHDPCYAASVDAKDAYCPNGADRKHLFAIALTKPLPRSLANRAGGTLQGLPATIVLSGGVTCGFITGATGVVAGMRINYGCTDHRMLIGDVDRRTAHWRIFVVAGRGKGDPELVDIDTAVY